MKHFEVPKIEVIRFAVEDILTASYSYAGVEIEFEAIDVPETMGINEFG